MHAREQFQQAYSIKLSGKTHRTILAFILCLEAVLAFSFLGFIQLPSISLTTLTIPVLIAAMYFGPLDGTAVAFIFAVASMWKAGLTSTEEGDLIFSPLQSGNPLGTLVMALGARILFALFAGMAFRWFFRSERKHRRLGVVAISLIATAVHALLVYLCMLVFFGAADAQTSNGFAKSLLINNAILYTVTALVTIGCDALMRQATIRRFFRVISAENIELTKGQKRSSWIMNGTVLAFAILISLHFMSRFVSFLTEQSQSFDPSFIPFTYSLLAQLVLGFVATFGVIAICFRWMREYFLIRTSDAQKAQQAREELLQNNARVLALEDDFESLYEVDLETGHYTTYVKGDFYRDNVTEKLASPGDYFADLRGNIDAVIWPEDREDLYRTLTRDAIRFELEKADHFDYFYRITTADGPAWFRLRVVYKDSDRNDIVIGVFDAADEMAEKEKNDRLITAFANENEVSLLFNLTDDSFKLLSNQGNDDRTGVLGVLADEYPTRTYADRYVHPDDRHHFYSDLYTSQGVKTKIPIGESYTFEYRRLTDDGYLWYRAGFKRIDENEVMIGYRKADEEILYRHLSEKVIADFASVFIVDLNHDRFRFVSRNSESGFPDIPDGCYSEMIREYISRVNPEYRETWYHVADPENVRELLTENSRHEYVYPLEGVEKRWRRCIIQTLDTENGVPSSFIMTYFVLDDTRAETLELTARVAEQNRKLEEEKQRTDTLHDIIHSGKWSFFVNAADEIVGADVSEEANRIIRNDVAADGHSWIQIVHPDDREAAEQAFHAAIRDHSGNTPYDVNYRMLGRDGIYRWFHSAGRVVRDAQGNGEFFGVHIDITDQIEAQLKQQDQIEESLTFTNFFLDTYVSAYYVDLTDMSCQTYKRTEELDRDYPIITNYLDSLSDYINRDVHPDDRRLLFDAIHPERMKQMLAERNEYSHIFRDISGGVEKTYRLQVIRGAERNHAAFGFIDISKEFAEQQERFRDADEAKKLIESVAGAYDVAYAVNMVDDSFKLLKQQGKLLINGERFKTYSESKTEFFRLVHPSDRERMKHELDYATIREKLSDKRSYNVEYRMLVDGSTSFHEMNVTYIDEDRVALGYAERDIELTKIHLEEKRYDEYFALFVVDVDTGMLKIVKNEEHFQEMPVGSSVPYKAYIQALAKTLDGDAQKFFRRISDLEVVRSELTGSEKQTFTYQTTHIAPGNAWIDVTAYALLRHEDGTPSMFTLGFSIADTLASERQELQKRLHEDMQMIGGLASGYHALYYFNIDEGFFKIYALDGKRLPKAAALVEQGGDPVAVFEKFANSDLVHPDDRDLFLVLTVDELRKRLAHQKKFTVRFRRNFSGEYRWNEMDVIKYEDADERANAIALGFADRDTEIRKEQEMLEQLESAKEAADAANQSKTAFLFNMSHDIRTPMNAIRGFTAMAKKNAGDGEKVGEYLDKIDISGQQLLSLINQVLEMARIESGKIEFEENPVSVRDEYNAMITVLSEQANVYGLKFLHSLGNVEHNRVLTDEARMSSITLNIAGNAMKYTPEGGTVSFDFREIAPRRDGYATFVLTVADTGIGMSQDYLENLYEPLSREKNSTVSKIQGTGLGLSIVKSIVDRMGGNIAVQSELGHGTRFDVTIDLKIDENAADDLAQTEAEEVVSFEGRRVLLVEDNEMNREIAKDILDEQGLVVEDAEDGDIAVSMVREALERGEPRYYDFILMDIQMPRMNGYEATRAIRALPWPDGERVPIVAMTANAFEEDRQNAIGSGMDEHLAKPINVPVMFKTISRFLKR